MSGRTVAVKSDCMSLSDLVVAVLAICPFLKLTINAEFVIKISSAAPCKLCSRFRIQSHLTVMSVTLNHY